MELNGSTFGGQLARRIERLDQIRYLLMHGPEWWPGNDGADICSRAFEYVKVLSAIDAINRTIEEVNNEADMEEWTRNQFVRELDILHHVLLNSEF